MARRQDQRCSNGWMNNAGCVGIGNIVIDTFTSGNLYLSTNINAKVGQVVAASTFDYTYQSGAINRMTLDITNGCHAAAGSIDVTFPTTGDTPVKGEYALARFTSGGDKLAGWTVTLNGQAVTSAFVRGMEVKVVKDATGLWLDVDKPGLAIIIR